MPAPPAPFTRVGIVGLGLIGGSIARAMRVRTPGVELVGVDHPEVGARARAAGAVDHTRPGVVDLVDCDLVVLAAPVLAIASLAREAGAARLSGIVTDVGSTKRVILDAASRGDVPHFVGGHPMAGGARGGLAEASPDLFAGRPWYLLSESAPVDLDAVEAWVASLGARPIRLDAETHDRRMAYVSHLPQWVAVALMDRVGESVGAAGLAQAGAGLADMTRLAGSPSDIWRDIFATNADFVGEAAAALASDLAVSAQGLGDGGAITQRFDRARIWRDLLMAARQSEVS